MQDLSRDPPTCLYPAPQNAQRACIFSVTQYHHWRIQGGAAGMCPPPPNRINFFCFRIHFHQKLYASEVDAPPTGRRPPNGKSWIRH